MKPIFHFLLLIMLCSHIQAQKEECLTVHLKKKSISLINNKAFTNDFFLVRNCVYNFILEYNKRIYGRLIDIKRDTLVVTNYFNKAQAEAFNDSFDTLGLHISEIEAISLIADRSLGITTKIRLSDYTINFKIDCDYYSYSPDSMELYKGDSTKFEILPILTAQGYDYIYEENGVTYLYRGKLIKSNPKQIDSTYRRKNIIYFTPSAVEEINGLAVGLWAENTKNGITGGNDSLKIRGVNIELMPFGFLWILGGTIFNNPEESMDLYNRMIKDNYELKVSGVNLSLSGTISSAKINGLNLSGLSTSVGDLNGLSISGFNTFAFKVNGVNISAIQNIAVRCRGVQIGLFNRARDLKGIQIGLWNNNGKNTTPIVNFRF